ncbi:hypothetical protein GE09DRAFT_689763 [Coniochaeta sp. 2T2.1]|nr:hypothetical protein GE09DRAFT_689763 [Coniochaeta sp. 2T2.1]
MCRYRQRNINLVTISKLVDSVRVFNKFFVHQADISELDYKTNNDEFNKGKQRHSLNDGADPANNFLSINEAFNVLHVLVLLVLLVHFFLAARIRLHLGYLYHQPEPTGSLPVLLQLRILSARALHLHILRRSGASAASDRRGWIPAGGRGCVVYWALQLYLYLRLLSDDGLYFSCRRHSSVTWENYSTLYY